MVNLRFNDMSSVLLKGTLAPLNVFFFSSISLSGMYQSKVHIYANDASITKEVKLLLTAEPRIIIIIIITHD